MKKLIVLTILAVFAFSKEYSIIAFSTKKFNQRAAEKFIQRFPNGIVKKYSDFVEYKIEPFKSYQAAKRFLPRVKKYYKYPLIIVYNPNLGEVLYPNTKITQKPKIENKKTETKSCNCQKEKKYPWEINKQEVLSQIDVKVKDYLPNESNESKTYQSVQNETNESTAQQCLFPPVENYFFYVDLYGNYYEGQKYKNDSIDGDSENIKLGVMYEKYFWDRWKFFTDDRIIFTRKHSNSKTDTDVYLDINELYVRSYCLNDDFTNILVGRKKTKDFRSWWYDFPLDEIKIFSENYLFDYELIFATRLNSDKILDEKGAKAKVKNSKFVIFHGDYEFYYNNHVGGYFIYEHSKPKDLYVDNRKMRFYGLELHGIKDDFLYWAYLGFSKGDIDYYTSTKSLSGHGFDVGVKYQKGDIGYALSYAYGSKENTQPIIATNNSDFLDKALKVRYYGEVMDPMLENIKILSFYVNYDRNEKEKLIASIHNYSQSVAESKIYNTSYFYPSDGKHKDLGNEVDVVYQYLMAKEQKLKLGLGYFIGSDAYDYLDRKSAYKIFANYRYYWK